MSLASHNARRRRDDKSKSKSKSLDATDDTASTLHGSTGDGGRSGLPRLDGVPDIAEWLAAQDTGHQLGTCQPPTSAAQAAEAAAVAARTTHVKLGNAHAVGDVPMEALPSALEFLLPGLSPMVASARYGCLLLSFDSLVPASAGGAASPEVVARNVAAVLRTHRGQALVPGSSVLLFSDDKDGPGAAGAPFPATEDDVAAAAAAGHLSATLPPLAAGWPGRVPPPLQGRVPGAALLQRRADGSTAVTLELGASLGGAQVVTSVHGRAHGLALAQEEAGSAQPVLILPASVARQACVTVLLEVQEVQGEPSGTTLSRPLPVLACHDAAVAAQVATTCAPLAQAGDDASWARERAGMDVVLRVCGAAFCPDAPLSVSVAAVKACLMLGWDALLLALLQAPNLSPVARGAVILTCFGHLRTGQPVARRAACAAVVQAAAVQLWPDAAPAAAAGLLLAAEVEGNCEPEMAAEAALLLATHDAGASAVLSSLQLMLLEGQPSLWHAREAVGISAPTSAAADAVTDDADAEARYATFLTVYNHNMWAMVGVLTPLAGLASLKCAWVDILSQSAVPLANRLDSLGSVKLDLLRQARLHPFVPGAATDVLQVPWPRVLAVARLEVLLLLLLRIPADLAILYLVAQHLSTRSRRARLMADPQLGEWLNHSLRKLTVATGAFYALQDVLLAWGTGGAAVEWPASTGAFYAFGEVVTFKAVLFPLPYNALSWLTCFLAYFTVLVWVPNMHVIVLRNYGYLLQVVALLTAGLLGRGREEAMRRLWRQSEAQGQGKQKQA